MRDTGYVMRDTGRRRREFTFEVSVKYIIVPRVSVAEYFGIPSRIRIAYPVSQYSAEVHVSMIDLLF